MQANEIAAGVFQVPVSIANVYLARPPGASWVLIDSAVPGSAQQIREAAESVYGPGTRPEAILLTHGHMDHAGSAAELADLWDVPIFAHPVEMPFLTGRLQYPPLDPTVGGFLATIGRFFHVPACDLGARVRPLEPRSEPPGLKGWEWHHTPGHSPGHVAFFRREDGTLLAGDALTTMNLDSMVATLAKRQRVCGPPAPSTTDWIAAAESVKFLAELWPVTIACGHGRPMSGDNAVVQLAELATNFPFPPHGRYVLEPARVDNMGILRLPPKPPDPLPAVAIGLGIAAAAGAMFALAAHRRKHRDDYEPGTSTADTPAPAS